MGNKSLTSKVAKLPASTDKYINSYENDNKESTTLLWFDPNFESRRDIEQTAQRLRLINDYIKFYTDLDQCVKFIRLIDREKIFLITCGSKTSELLSHVSCLRQVNSIFIYCTKKQSYEHSKIIDSYTNLDELCDAIQNRIDLFDHQLQTFSFFDQNKQSTRDLSKDSGEFIWFQLFNHVIARFPRIEEAKQEMIEMCRQYYHGNSKELTLINQFESDYESEEAIYCDLSECLRREHKKILLSNEEFFTVYRGGKLDIEEFNKLKENQGKLISMNGYLSTSRRRPQTHDIATKLVKRTDVVSVLFQIEVHIKKIGNSVNFADITQFSEYPNGKEVLFDLNTCFKIESIEQDGSIELIRMKLSNPGEMITKDYIELTLRKTEEKSVAIVFGRLMCNLGQYDKSQHYFEQLRKDPNGENLAWIEFNIGRVLCYKGEWKEARDHFDCAYDRMVANKPVRVKDSTRVLDKIGLILENQGKYDEALGYYKQALDIKEKCYLPGSVSIAASFNHIGNILSSQKKYNEALDFYKRALDIEGKCFSSGHVNIAANHNKIGIILRGQGRYDEALKYYQRALEMQEEHYPSGHADIAHSLSNIGHILFDQAKYDEALDYYQRALKMREKYYPSCDIAIVQSLNNIGGLLFEHEKYDEALDYYKRLLKIQEDYYSSDELDIAQSFNKLGKILYHQQRYDTALHYHQRALKIQVKHYSSDYVDIATSLNNIGLILEKQVKYDEALDYYQRSLKIQEESYPFGHVYVARNLTSIGDILYHQRNYDDALDYYQRSLKMQEEYYRSGHVEIAKSLYSIGTIFYDQENYDEALDYFQRALKMREKYCSSDHVNIGESLNIIGICYEKQNKTKIALDYYHRPMTIFMKFLPPDHPSRIRIEERIHRLTKKK
ncbi:unnamed protein product [Rotaria socialis]|uniref:ADP ribosyltransferase domain-containing protein n=2 Tax=Rotaria socialis TaxID=392032 RepID=A0A820TB82_9BILA|nr:unnamed protein product [Rotaria socialis]CAF4351442.1 unnamed protein product [Rotaria socialis]CAF4463962.1 unnamed protein product [Rotaria socialis]